MLRLRTLAPPQRPKNNGRARMSRYSSRRGSLCSLEAPHAWRDRIEWKSMGENQPLNKSGLAACTTTADADWSTRVHSGRGMQRRRGAHTPHGGKVAGLWWCGRGSRSQRSERVMHYQSVAAIRCLRTENALRRRHTHTHRSSDDVNTTRAVISLVTTH